MSRAIASRLRRLERARFIPLLAHPDGTPMTQEEIEALFPKPMTAEEWEASLEARYASGSKAQ